MSVKRVNRSRHFSVGFDLVAQCLAKKLAMCDCVILQPTPDYEGPSDKTLYKSKRGTPLFPSHTRQLVLWNDQAVNDYHLTIITEDKDEVFLDLPLSGIVTGKISYHQESALWHEVTVQSDSPSYQGPKCFVLNLQSSADSKRQAEDFSKTLAQVLEQVRLPKIEKTLPLTSGVGNSPCQNEKLAEVFPVKGLYPSQLLDMSISTAMAAVTRPPVTVAQVTAAAPKMAGGDFSSSLAASRLAARLTAKEVQLLIGDLAAAVAAGNNDRACEVVSRLAQNHTHLTIQHDTAAEELKLREQEISVTVHVEDRESPGLTLSDIKLWPSLTILHLKHMFLSKFHFPVEVQKWIIGNRICNDEETLSKCDVCTSGSTLYLYLLNARSVMPREQFERQWRAQNPTEESAQVSSEMNRPPALSQTSGDTGFGALTGSVQGTATPSNAATSRQQSHLSTSSSLLASGSLGMADPHPQLTSSGQGRRGSDARLTAGGTLVAAAAGGRGDDLLPTTLAGWESETEMESRTEEEPSVSSSSQGWECQTCTLINQPTRPGCEACGSPRPTSYKIPANLILSEEEQRRLRHEQELETILHQRLPGGLGRGDATITTPFGTSPQPPSLSDNLTPEKLDLILRFNDAIQAELAASQRLQPSPVLTFDPTRRGHAGHSQLVPSGVQQRRSNAGRMVGEEEGALGEVPHFDVGEDLVDFSGNGDLINWDPANDPLD